MKAGKIALFVFVMALGFGMAFSGTADAKRGSGNRMEQQLTPEQQAKYKQIMDESRAATADLRKDLEAKRTELQEILKSDSPDKSRIETLSAEIGVLRGKMLVARVDTNARLKQEGLPTRPLVKPAKSGSKDVKGKRGERAPRGEQAAPESAN